MQSEVKTYVHDFLNRNKCEEAITFKVICISNFLAYCVQSRQYLFHVPDIVFDNCQMFNLLIEKLSACMIYTVNFINTCIRYLME